eukprot:TRINITY_DN20007_c0_g1_i1.p1 TRINITY_DN20007_c0_g1~~TRINITY_DN20007_c0_g1_i1.p1  ORF type:complete len:716 (+),score=92.52 TRINITY_DN20007_c0_g1_i1:96-2243(+)
MQLIPRPSGRVTAGLLIETIVCAYITYVLTLALPLYLLEVDESMITEVKVAPDPCGGSDSTVTIKLSRPLIVEPMCSGVLSVSTAGCELLTLRLHSITNTNIKLDQVTLSKGFLNCDLPAQKKVDVKLSFSCSWSLVPYTYSGEESFSADLDDISFDSSSPPSTPTPSPSESEVTEEPTEITIDTRDELDKLKDRVESFSLMENYPAQSGFNFSLSVPITRVRVARSEYRVTFSPSSNATFAVTYGDGLLTFESTYYTLPDLHSRDDITFTFLDHEDNPRCSFVKKDGFNLNATRESTYLYQEDEEVIPVPPKNSDGRPVRVRVIERDWAIKFVKVTMMGRSSPTQLSFEGHFKSQNLKKFQYQFGGSSFPDIKFDGLFDVILAEDGFFCKECDLMYPSFSFQNINNTAFSQRVLQPVITNTGPPLDLTLTLDGCTRGLLATALCQMGPSGFTSRGPLDYIGQAASAFISSKDYENYVRVISSDEKRTVFRMEKELPFIASFFVSVPVSFPNVFGPITGPSAAPSNDVELNGEISISSDPGIEVDVSVWKGDLSEASIDQVQWPSDYLLGRATTLRIDARASNFPYFFEHNVGDLRSVSVSGCNQTTCAIVFKNRFESVDLSIRPLLNQEGIFRISKEGGLTDSVQIPLLETKITKGTPFVLSVPIPDSGNDTAVTGISISRIGLCYTGGDTCVPLCGQLLCSDPSVACFSTADD